MPKAPKRKAAETIKFTADLAAGESTSRRFAALLVIQGAEADLGLHVVCDRPITLGRDPDVELPLRDGSTSRRHCRVERDEDTGRYVLKDLGSTNGTHVNGTRVHSAVPLAEGDKVFLGASVVKFSFADSVDVQYQARLDHMVSTDALTGLLSRRRFDAEFAAAVMARLIDGVALSVLVMDMDGLKKINDTHGHEMGGFAITEVAALIRAALTGHGETCRYGGDEFVSFLPGHGKTDAARLALEIRDAVAAHRFCKSGVTVTPTISIGVSSLPDDGEEPGALFRAADKCLYRAKAAGKNQVVS
jgi:two-component system, cell cycle response regulator